MKPGIAAVMAIIVFGVGISMSPAFGQSFLSQTFPGAAKHRQAKIFIPDSSIEQPGDNRVRAHTNHLILVTPDSGLGPNNGMTPAQLRQAYGLPATGGANTIAIIDAYDYPTATSDFNVFAAQFGLPQETGNGQVFQVVYAGTRKPRGNSGWNQEAALDIEWAHAMAPNAKIVLVEANSTSYADLFAAVQKANGMSGVKEVSMSWGGSEASDEATYDSPNFSQPGIVYFAASGDTGGMTIYPGVSPNVVAAGGTSVATDSNGNYLGETGWSGTGGGPSQYEPRPSYQDGVANIVGSARGVPDVSFDADPNTGVSVYDSTPSQGMSGWLVFGGTSVAAPSLAGIVNLAGHDSGSSAQELQLIYSGLGGPHFHDITSGTAGSYTAAVGWDYVTGVGSTYDYVDLQLPPVPISGTASLQGWAGTEAMPALTCTLTPTGTTGGSVITQVVTPASDGSFTLNNVPAGTYTLGIKGSRWLRKDVSVDTTGGSISGLSVALVAGDVNGDNVINGADISAVAAAFRAHAGDANWNPNCDLNGDGVVNGADISIVSANFRKTGDP